MKVITVEEHVATPALLRAWSDVGPEHHDDATDLYGGPLGPALLDVGDERLAWMDRMGVDVQVLSVTTPGVQNLDPVPAVALAREANDLIAAAVAAHPDRYQGLATLPTPDPAAAAAELRRAVVELGLHGAMTFGRTRERPLDHPDNEPLLAVANELRVPLFLHPQIPPRAVRDALYSGLPARFDFAVGTAALGWHYEAGVAFLRLVLSGAFDRHPDLRIVAGHWGDLLPFYLDEVDIAPRLAGAEMRPISEYYRRHLYVAPSGTLSARYVDWAIDVLGVDHLLFALDYPFAPRAPGDVAAFLRHPSLDGVAREQVAGANWEGLVAAIVR